MATKSKKNRTIVLPIPEKKYSEFVKSPSRAHETIKENIDKTPELFPLAIIKKGYVLKGKDRMSKKLDIQLRRIKIGDTVYRIRPGFLMPYMRGKTKDVENALLLIRFGVPFWAIAIVFGRNPMYWYKVL